MATIDLVKEFLSSEGYRFEIDSDGDVHFKYEGMHLYFTVDLKDQQFFRIIMPGLYEVTNDRVKVLEAINTVCKDFKVLKAFLVQDSLWLAIEMFLDTSPELDDFFRRCLFLLQQGARRMAELIRE